MGRPKGVCNKKEKTEPKYRVIQRNVFEGTESSMEFATIKAISQYMKERGMEMSESTITNYMVGFRNPPALLKFVKI